MSLEDRLDERLVEPSAEDGPLGLAERWKLNRRQRDAAIFDEIADQIETGLLKIKGPPPNKVVARLRERAEGVRAGTDKLRRRPPMAKAQED